MPSIANVAAASAEAAAPVGAAEAGEGPAAAAEPTKPTVRKIEYKEAKPVDLLETAGSPVLKRLAPAVVIVLILLFILRRLRK